MALEVMTKSVDLNESLPAFDFSGQVTAFVYGLSGFYLSFGDDDHHLQTASVTLNATLNDNLVNVTPTIVFKDHSGNSYSASDSTISVTVVAWVGEGADRNVKFVNWGRSIENGQSSETIDIGTRPLSTNALLAGFDVSYGDTDHHVERIFANVGTDPSGKNVKLTASVGMYDHSGNNASTKTANAGLLATVAKEPGFEIQVIPQGGHTVTFKEEVDEVVAIINGFDVSYSGTDHHVEDFGLYCFLTRSALTSPWNGIYSYQPTPKNAFLIADPDLYDDSDHSGNGKCSMIVIGRYKQEKKEQNT